MEPQRRSSGTRIPLTRWAAAVPDSPWVPALVMLLAGLAVMLARLEVVAKGDISVFILPGAKFTHPSQLLPGVHVFPTSGYDGQFFYRLATDPAAINRAFVHGITLDTPYRLQRIGYPVLAWLAALGRPRWVPWSLVGVNLVCLGALGYVGGLFARESGRHAAWGLLLAGYWGYVFSISRDVAEVPAGLFLMLALWFLRRAYPAAGATGGAGHAGRGPRPDMSGPRPDMVVWAGLAFTASVLTRETGMAVVAAVALLLLYQLWTVRSDRPARGGALFAQLAWVVPTVAFGLWQVVIRVSTGKGAATTDTGANLGTPFIAALKAVHHDLLSLNQRESQYSIGEILILALISALALWLWRSSRARGWDKLGWIFIAGLVLSLSGTVWSGDADLRSMDELYILDVLLLFGTRRRLWLPAALTALAWVLVAIHQVRAI